MSDALTELEAWLRKHYTAEIALGPGTDHCDEGYVQLRAGGRAVTVMPYDKPQPEGGDAPLDRYTTAEMIREALRLWHADASPKVYRVMVSTREPVEPPAGAEFWGSAGTSFMVRAVAANEPEAAAAAVALFPGGCGASVSAKAVWERGPAA